MPLPATAAPTTAAPAASSPTALHLPAALPLPAAAPARPPALHRVVRPFGLRATASAAGARLVTVGTGAYLVAQDSGNGWIKVGHAGRTGWFPAGYARKLDQIQYQATRAVAVTTRPGAGSAVVSLAAGRSAVSTGRVSGGHVQVYSAGKTGWAPAAALRRAVVAKYQTNVAAYLYATAHSPTRVATLPADYTHATRTNRALNGRIHVEYGGTSGWIGAAKVTRVALGTAVGKLAWRQSAAKNVARWCRGVPITAGRGLGNFASMSGSPGRWKESITLDTAGLRGGTLDPNHPQAVAIQYHECAHILQYRAYDYRPGTLASRMDTVYGRSNGTEFMADCMALAMGTKLSGTSSDGWTWRAGYGGKCTSAHLAAAKKVIAGQAV